MPETYTAVECAHRMGIRPETLRELIRKKELPFGFSYQMCIRDRGGWM